MNDDQVRAALRRDAEMLLDLAPPPEAASLWHEVQRARAGRLKRITDICGWSVRAGAASSALGVALWAPDALSVFIGPLALIGWLSTGICTPIAVRDRRADVRKAAKPSSAP